LDFIKTAPFMGPFNFDQRKNTYLQGKILKNKKVEQYGWKIEVGSNNVQISERHINDLIGFRREIWADCVIDSDYSSGSGKKIAYHYLDPDGVLHSYNYDYSKGKSKLKPAPQQQEAKE
jgi:hypothetical protein